MVARERKEDFLVIHCNVGNDQHQDVLDFFGIKMSETPSFMIFELESSNKYRPTTSGPTDISIRNMLCLQYLSEHLDATGRFNLVHLT